MTTTAIPSSASSLIDDRADVDASRRFVENHQLRFLYERFCDDDLLLVSTRELDDPGAWVNGADSKALRPFGRHLARLRYGDQRQRILARCQLANLNVLCD